MIAAFPRRRSKPSYFKRCLNTSTIQTKQYERGARILKPGGILYADVPNEEGLYARFGNMYQRARGRDWVVNLSRTVSPFHVFGYSPRSLKALYRKHKLEPFGFSVRGGKSSLPRVGGVSGWVEQKAAGLVTDVANALEMGTYIASWARKNPDSRMA